MGSLTRGISRTTGLVAPALIVVVGSLAATVVTDTMADNVYEIPFKGGDAAYPLIATVVLNMFMSGNTARLASLGMVASSGSELAKSYGLI